LLCFVTYVPEALALVFTFTAKTKLPQQFFLFAKLFERKLTMKITKLIALVVTIALALFILIPSLSWAADDGAATYKAKCSACHGADAAGKPAAKIPSLTSDEVKKLSDDDLAKAIAGTAKHPAGVKSLPGDDVKAVVAYIRSLQK
jgi:mono/diheme cytochrome c family protein